MQSTAFYLFNPRFKRDLKNNSIRFQIRNALFYNPIIKINKRFCCQYPTTATQAKKTLLTWINQNALYKGRDTDMLLAIFTIVASAISHETFLASKHSKWAPPYFTNLRKEKTELSKQVNRIKSLK